MKTKKASDDGPMRKINWKFVAKHVLIFSLFALIVWNGIDFYYAYDRAQKAEFVNRMRVQMWSNVTYSPHHGKYGYIPDGGWLVQQEVETETADDVLPPVVEVVIEETPERFFLPTGTPETLECYNLTVMARVYRYKKTIDNVMTANLDALEISRNPLYLSDPSLLIMALIAQESGGSPSLVSTDGFNTVGLMQISPRNKTYSEQMLKNPAINVGLGVQILNQTIEHYYDEPLSDQLVEAMSFFYQVPEERMRDPVFLGLAAYNCGYTSLEAARCKSFGGPTYAELIYSCWIPALETYHLTEIGAEEYAKEPYWLPRAKMIELLGFLADPGDATTIVSVRVNRKDVMTYKIERYNRSGAPIFERHDVGDRLYLEKGAVLDVFAKKIYADGGHVFYQLRYFPGHYVPASVVDVLKE